jgi:rare lipoprotein A
MTCAHRTFPFGTYLRVTNPASDRSVIVRVNDRGPYLHGRIIDLSWGAARKLGILSQGVASVIVERIGSAVIPLKDTSQVILPELGLATLASYQDAVPEWQDTVNINHRRLNRKMEQTVRNSWIDMILNRLRKK